MQKSKDGVFFRIVANEMYIFLCFFLAGYTTLYQFLYYHDNVDTSSISYKLFKFNSEDGYPTYSFCFVSTPWYNLKSLYDEDLDRKYAINSLEWTELMKGRSIEKKYWKTSLDFSNFSFPSKEFNLELQTFLKSFNNVAIKFEMDDNNETRTFGKYKKENETWPFFLSYENPDTICFSRRHENEIHSFRTNDMIWMDLKYFQYTRLFLHVYLHHPGQLTRSLGKPQFKTYGTELDSSNNKVTLKIGQVSVLRRREDAKVPCNSGLKNDDERFRQEVIKQVGCVPIYWTSFTSYDNNTKICTLSTEMSEIYFFLSNRQKITSLYDQPCNYMKTSVTAHQQPYFLKYMLLKFVYMDEYYQEFINFREFGLDGLGARVGGLVGIFLGYSLLQVPNALCELWIWLNQFKLSLISKPLQYKKS